MSERVERRLVELLEDPVVSPYGNPIPGLEKLGVSRAQQVSEQLVTLRRVAEEGGDVEDGDVEGGAADGGAGRAWRVQRLAESIQVEPEVLEQLLEAGIRPGVRVTPGEVTEAYVSLVVASEDAGEEIEVELPLEVAQHIFVDRG